VAFRCRHAVGIPGRQPFHPTVVRTGANCVLGITKALDGKAIKGNTNSAKSFKFYKTRVCYKPKSPCILSRVRTVKKLRCSTYKAKPRWGGGRGHFSNDSEFRLSSTRKKETHNWTPQEKTKGPWGVTFGLSHLRSSNGLQHELNRPPAKARYVWAPQAKPNRRAEGTKKNVHYLNALRPSRPLFEDRSTLGVQGQNSRCGQGGKNALAVG